MTETVRLSGFRELERELEKLSKAAGKGVLRRAGIKALKPMAAIAAALAPDDPATPAPDLHTSITVGSKAKVGRSLEALREGPASVNVYMGPSVKGYPQAIFQEFGTVKAKAQPYMRPAWDQDRHAMLERLKDDLWAIVQKAVARAEARARAKG